MFKKMIDDIWMDYENEAYLDHYLPYSLFISLVTLEQIANYIT